MRIVKPVVGILAVVGLYAAAGYLIVPSAVKSAVQSNLPALLDGSQADIESVSFNPWTWRLEMRNLVVWGQTAGSEVLRMADLQTKINVRTLLARAPIVDELTVNALHFNYVAPLRVNGLGEDTQERAQKKAKDVAQSTPSPEGLPAFSLSNVTLRDSSVTLTNASNKSTVHITDINFALPVISTLEHAALTNVKPSLSLKIDGNPVTATGKLDGGTALLSLQTERLDAAKLVQALGLRAPYTLQSALVSAQLTMQSSANGSNPPAVRLQGDAKIEAVDVRNAKGDAFASADAVNVHLSGFDLARQNVHIGSVHLDRPFLAAEIDSGLSQKKQSAQTSKTSQAAAPAAKADATASGWQWAVDEVSLRNGTVSLTDTGVRPAGALTISKIDLDAQGFSSKPGSKGSWSLSAMLGHGSVQGTGLATLSPLAVQADAKAEQLDIALFNPWIKPIAGASFDRATTSAGGKIDFASGAQARLTWQGDLTVENLHARNAAGKTIMTWHRLDAEGMNLKSVSPVNLSVAKLTVKDIAQKATQTTGKIMGILSRLAKAAGQESIARRAEKVTEAVSQDIVLEDIAYQNGRFSLKGKDRSSLGSVVLEALNKVFEKKKK